MPDDFSSPLKHLRFNAPFENLKFSGKAGGGRVPPISRDRDEHTRRLASLLGNVGDAFEKIAKTRTDESLSAEFGLILNVVSEPNYPLAFTSLENHPRGNVPAIVLLNIRHQNTPQGRVTKAAIFVPHGQLGLPPASPSAIRIIGPKRSADSLSTRPDGPPSY